MVARFLGFVFCRPDWRARSVRYRYGTGTVGRTRGGWVVPSRDAKPLTPWLPPLLEPRSAQRRPSHSLPHGTLGPPTAFATAPNIQAERRRSRGARVARRCGRHRRSRTRAARRPCRAHPGGRTSKVETGQHHQARAENTFYRYKTTFGGRLRARDDGAQRSEVSTEWQSLGCRFPRRSVPERCIPPSLGRRSIVAPTPRRATLTLLAPVTEK